MRCRHHPEQCHHQHVSYSSINLHTLDCGFCWKLYGYWQKQWCGLSFALTLFHWMWWCYSNNSEWQSLWVPFLVIDLIKLSLTSELHLLSHYSIDLKFIEYKLKNFFLSFFGILSSFNSFTLLHFICFDSEVVWFEL